MTTDFWFIRRYQTFFYMFFLVYYGKLLRQRYVILVTFNLIVDWIGPEFPLTHWLELRLIIFSIRHEVKKAI